jgi:hypothetical protein
MLGAAAALLLAAPSARLAAFQPRMAPAERIPLTYDSRLADADLASPAARLTFNGQTAWFLVDTGAGVHVIASWFAQAARLAPDAELVKEVRAVDSTGAALPFRAIRHARGRLPEGAVVDLSVAMITDFADDFEQLRIGGIISPQLLAGDGRVATLDLRTPELRLETFGDAVRRLGAAPLPHDAVRFCGAADGPLPNLAVAIPVAAGRQRGIVTVDTGATITRLTAGSRLIRGVRLRHGGEASGLSGNPQLYALAPDLRIEFGGYAATVDARVSDASGQDCGPDGLLGLDAIRGCALVIGAGDFAIACGTRRGM